MAGLHGRVADLPERVARLVNWARARLETIEQSFGPAALEERLQRERVFGEDELCAS